MDKNITYHRKRANENGDQNHVTRIVVFYMRQFMGNHSFQFFILKNPNKSRCERDRSVFWISPSRKRIWRIILNNIDARAGKPSRNT